MYKYSLYNNTSQYPYLIKTEKPTLNNNNKKSTTQHIPTYLSTLKHSNPIKPTSSSFNSSSPYNIL